MNISLPPIPLLASDLQKLIAQIPIGQVTTHGTLAQALGAKVAARWVGEFVLDHPHDEQCNCHRVVRADGSLGDYVTGEAHTKQRRLAAEGIEICSHKVIWADPPFDVFQSERPLATLREYQEELRERVVLKSVCAEPKLVGGVDVSYTPDCPAIAAYALVDAESGDLLWSTTVQQPVTFPYITSFLSYRELPLYAELLEKVDKARKLPDVLMVDGSGILHPRGTGSATHLGIAADIPTIGVAKKLLCGTLDKELTYNQQCNIMWEQKKVGIAITSHRSRKPLFVSPGHRMSVVNAGRIAKAMIDKWRLPTPIYWADRLSRDAGKAFVR